MHSRRWGVSSGAKQLTNCGNADDEEKAGGKLHDGVGRYGRFFPVSRESASWIVWFLCFFMSSRSLCSHVVDE